MTRCTYRTGWGGVPGAPRPPAGPVTYQCVLERHAEGDHAIEIDGVRLARERIGRGEYARGPSDGRRELISFRVRDEVHAALVAEARIRNTSEHLVAQGIVEAWAKRKKARRAP